MNMKWFAAILGLAALAAGAMVGCAATAVSQAATQPVTHDVNNSGAEQVVAKSVDWDGNDDDPESNTHWTKSPTYVRDKDGGLHSLGLKSFEGVEEPTMIFVLTPGGATQPAAQSAATQTAGSRRGRRNQGPNGTAVKDNFINITDEGNGVVKMFLRYRWDGGNNGGWWDGDQGTARRDRQRAEIKGLGPHQKDGETFEYGTTFRTDPDFKAYGRFCHIMQVKATDGDKGAPLVTLSIIDDTHGALRYVSGNNGFRTAREFTWKPGEWETIRFRLKTSTTNDGELLLSVNGDEFKGVTGVPIYRPNATDYRPKWGLYRGVVKGMHDDWVEHKEGYTRKIAP